MKLRRIASVYAIAFGVPLALLGGGATPAAVAPGPAAPGLLLRPVGMPTTLAPQTTLTPALSRPRSPAHFELGHDDIPVTALQAYQRAADILATVSPSCQLSWTLLAAIGRVESDHGRYAGATLSPDGVSTPRVVGVALDGQGPVAKIHDTDHGRLDGDPTWDRAVGPMQFLPSTWSLVGVDADGDGKRSINDINDAALAAGVYLCAGAPFGLGSTAAVDEALHRYNDSDSYAALVMAYERLYRGGKFKVLTPSDGFPQATAALLAQPLVGSLTGPLAGIPAGVASRKHPAGTARLGHEVRDAVVTTRKHHATKNQQEATGGTTAGRTGTEAASGDSTAGSTSGDGGGSTPGSTDAGATGPDAGTGSGAGTDGSSTDGSSPGDSSTDTGGTGAGGTPTAAGPTDAGSADSGSTGSGSTGSGSTGSGSTDSGSTDSGSTDSGSTGSAGGSGDGAGSTASASDGQSPTDSPSTAPTEVTAVLTVQDGVYLLGGKRLDLGPAGQAEATAAADFDGDGSVETNADELTGLLDRTVTMVVVEREDGSLGVVSINGVSLG